MVADHVTIFLTPERPPVIYLLGRLVFPLFAMSLAYGLGAGGSLTFADVSKRLLMWAVIAQVPYSLLINGVVLNVLFTFWAAVTLYAAAAFPGWNWARGLLVALALLICGFVEFGPIGVGFTVAAIGVQRFEGSARRWWWGAFWLSITLLHAVNGVPVAMVAPFVFWALVRWAEVPRVRHAFYWLYPAQFAAIAAVRAVT